MPTRRKEDAAFYCTPLGYLGAAAPKPVFAYFCLAAKVGRARGREISPGRGVLETPRPAPRTSGARKAAPFFDGGAVKLGGTTKYRTLYALVPWSVGREHFFMDPRRAQPLCPPGKERSHPSIVFSAAPAGGRFRAPFRAFRFARPCCGAGSAVPARGNFAPPGTTYFCRQAKVGKNWLRGCGP